MRSSIHESELGRRRSEDSLQKQRERANRRERDRTRALNAAYSRLRQKIPSLPSDKTSKIHTLRVTVEYIQFLRELASDNNNLNVDFARTDDNQINIAATFNSWRTGMSQRRGCKPKLLDRPGCSSVPTPGADCLQKASTSRPSEQHANHLMLQSAGQFERKQSPCFGLGQRRAALPGPAFWAEPSPSGRRHSPAMQASMPLSTALGHAITHSQL